MNVYEISVVGTPVVGILAGIRATRGGTFWHSVCRGLVGLVVGIAIEVTLIIFVRCAEKARMHDKDKNMICLKVALDGITVWLAVAAPVVAWVATSLVTKALLM